MSLHGLLILPVVSPYNQSMAIRPVSGTMAISPPMEEIFLPTATSESMTIKLSSK